MAGRREETAALYRQAQAIDAAQSTSPLLRLRLIGHRMLWIPCGLEEATLRCTPQPLMFRWLPCHFQIGWLAASWATPCLRYQPQQQQRAEQRRRARIARSMRRSLGFSQCIRRMLRLVGGAAAA